MFVRWDIEQLSRTYSTTRRIKMPEVVPRSSLSLGERGRGLLCSHSLARRKALILSKLNTAPLPLLPVLLLIVRPAPHFLTSVLLDEQNKLTQFSYSLDNINFRNKQHHTSDCRGRWDSFIHYCCHERCYWRQGFKKHRCRVGVSKSSRGTYYTSLWDIASWFFLHLLRCTNNRNLISWGT